MKKGVARDGAKSSFSFLGKAFFRLPAMAKNAIFPVRWEARPA